MKMEGSGKDKVLVWVGVTLDHGFIGCLGAMERERDRIRSRAVQGRISRWCMDSGMN